MISPTIIFLAMSSALYLTPELYYGFPHVAAPS